MVLRDAKERFIPLMIRGHSEYVKSFFCKLSTILAAQIRLTAYHRLVLIFLKSLLSPACTARS